MTVSENPATARFGAEPFSALDRQPSGEEALLPQAPATGEPRSASSSGHETVVADGAGRWLWLQRPAEVIVALGSSALFVGLSRAIDVNPLVRVGQVSGLAALQFRFALLCVVVVLALLPIELLRLGFAPFARKLACAAVAGLSSGLVAGGIVVALHGTPWGLFVNHSDVGSWMPQWTQLVLDGQSLPRHYPPFSIYALAAFQYFGDEPFGFALKQFQIVVTALYCPAAYLMWRMTLKPVWALGIGCVTTLPFIEPFKPYTLIVLVMLIPLLAKFLQVTRYSTGLSWRRAVLLGLGFGIGFGLLFLTYSGWFVWGAPGAVAAWVILVPWRTGLKPAAIITGTTLVAFVATSWIHLLGLLGQSGANSDSFMYFDTNTDPGYIAMWRDDMPGLAASGPWPPFGELAGVGVFTLLLTFGLGLAIAFGWRRTTMIAIGLPIAGAWLLRQLLASQMYESGLVRLYPRTTMFVLLGLLLLSGFAVMWVSQAVGRTVSKLAGRFADAEHRSGPDAGRPEPATGAVGGQQKPWVWRAAPTALALIPLMFVFASAGSAIADRFMPANSTDRSRFAWVSHATKLPDGSCPEFSQGVACDN